MRLRYFFTFLGIVSALAFVPIANAANLFIDDSVEAQITLNHDANWEFGVTSNGTAFPGNVPGSTTAPGESATFSGTWFVNGPGSPDPGTGIIYFVDFPGSKHNTIDDHKGKKPHVSDIVTADWSTVAGGPFFGVATISFTITSSACGENLGAVPRNFRSDDLVVFDPSSPIEISGLFRDPVTTDPVAIPANLTVQFVGNADTGCSDDDD
jgi:hypothetical protein